MGAHYRHLLLKRKLPLRNLQQPPKATKLTGNGALGTTALAVTSYAASLPGQRAHTSPNLRGEKITREVFVACPIPGFRWLK